MLAGSTSDEGSVPPGRDLDRCRAYHSAEPAYVFDALHAVDRQIADQMSSYWANFAATGNPDGADRSEWPVYDPEDRIALEFGDTIRTRLVLDEIVLKFYDDRMQPAMDR